MLCPYCHQEIPNIPGYIYICPFCYTPLTNRLTEKLIPKFDREGNPVIQYSPTAQYIEQKGAINYIGYEDNRKKQKSTTKTQTQTWWSYLLIGLVLFFGSIITGWGGSLTTLGLYMIFVSIIRLCDKKPASNPEAEALFSEIDNTPVPIAFYGNDNIFGYASVYADCNAYAEFPQIMRSEYRKSDIFALTEFPGDNVRVSYYDINRRLQKFTIPAFCGIEDLKQILGINDNSQKPNPQYTRASAPIRYR